MNNNFTLKQIKFAFILIGFIICLILIGFDYSICSLIGYDLNIANWSVPLKIFFAVIFFISIRLVVSSTYKAYTEKKIIYLSKTN